MRIIVGKSAIGRGTTSKH